MCCRKGGGGGGGVDVSIAEIGGMCCRKGGGGDQKMGVMYCENVGYAEVGGYVYRDVSIYMHAYTDTHMLSCY